MQTKEVNHSLVITTKDLLRVLASFSPDQLNATPAGGGWSAGQVADHLIKASVVEPLYGPVAPTQRAPDEYVQPLRDQFLDFNTKMNSPAFILPGNGPYSRESLLEELESIGTKIRTAILTLDLSASCLWVPRELGELTRWELIHFHLFHTQRHTHQLKQIYQSVTNPISQTSPG